MPSCRLAASMSLVAAGVLGLCACSAEKPSGLKVYTPSPSSHSSAPSSTTTSKWTPDQLAVIQTTLTYHSLVSKYSKGAKLDMAALRTVATEPSATLAGKNISNGLSIGFVQHGDDAHEIRTVSIAGAKSTLTECWIGRSYGVNRIMAPPVTTKPLATRIVTFKLALSAGAWRVSEFTDGAACAAKG